MALPATGTVPTTSRDDASVEIEASTIEPVDPADVDSGADIANRATNLSAGRTTTPAELDGAVRGNETAFAVLETYYQDPQQALDRLQDLGPAEREALSRGDLDVLGELRPEAASADSLNGIDRDLVGPGLSAYSQDRNDYSASYEAADAREQDRANGREPGVDPADPNQDPTIDGEGGQSPSTSGQAGTPQQNKPSPPTVEEMMERQVSQISMSPNL